MLLWLLFAALTAAVITVALRPLSGPASSHAPAEAERIAANVAVHKARLAEIEGDVARGILQPAEAEAARLELSRQLLAAAGPVAPVMPAPGGLTAATRGRLQLAAMLAVPAIALPLYLLHGSPMYSAEPGPVASLSPEQLIAGVEQRLQAAPDDGRGWDLIAPIYRKIGRYTDAAAAYAKAARLLGDSADRAEGEAESLILAADSQVTPPAAAALERARTLEPGRFRPRFWLAVAAEQRGDGPAAVAQYRALLADPGSTPQARAILEQRLAVLAPKPAGTEGKGPTEADMANAAGMSADDQSAMIRGMVEGLAARLATDGRDAAGWQKLIRAYAVLGERDKAVAALASARKALAADAPGLSALDTLSKDIGLVP